MLLLITEHAGGDAFIDSEIVLRWFIVASLIIAGVVAFIFGILVHREANGEERDDGKDPRAR